MERGELVRRVTAWLEANPGVFDYRVDGDRITLVERLTGKERVFSGDDVTEIHERKNRLSGVAYPILLLESGTQIAVTDIGFCFAPSFAATGEIPGGPDVVSFGDFRRLYQEARFAADDPERRKDALDLMMLCISIVDGGRDAGFNVGEEEDRLETLLRRLEQGTVDGHTPT
jgi:hypothetical protein